MKLLPKSSRPTVLMLHSSYVQKGGEESSYSAERAVFRELGYEVVEITGSNSEAAATFGSAGAAIFNVKIFIRSLKMMRRTRPNFLYANNLWLSISPSPLLAAALLGIPVLQALRNYRLVTPSAMLQDDGRCLVCRRQQRSIACVMAGCFRGSILSSTVVLLSSALNRLFARMNRKHYFLATSAAAARVLIQKGMPSRKLIVRPNFIEPAWASRPALERSGVAFVGRLSPEKDVVKLASFWAHHPELPLLTIAGDGPDLAEVTRIADSSTNVSVMGRLSPQEVSALVAGSRSLIVPSNWCEPFGRVAIEAMSLGTPVIYTKTGALPEIVGETGLPIDLDATDLSVDIARFLDNESALRELSSRAIQRVNQRYTSAVAVTEMASIVSRCTRK